MILQAPSPTAEPREADRERSPAAPDRARVAARAYDLWRLEGCPEGMAERHWQTAEEVERLMDRLYSVN